MLGYLGHRPAQGGDARQLCGGIANDLRGRWGIYARSRAMLHVWASFSERNSSDFTPPGRRTQTGRLEIKAGCSVPQVHRGPDFLGEGSAGQTLCHRGPRHPEHQSNNQERRVAIKETNPDSSARPGSTYVTLGPVCPQGDEAHAVV